MSKNKFQHQKGATYQYHICIQVLFSAVGLVIYQWKALGMGKQEPMRNWTSGDIHTHPVAMVTEKAGKK